MRNKKTFRTGNVSGRKPYVVVALAFAFCFLLAADVFAANITWDGGGATNNWSEAANWSGDVVPGASDTAIFDATSAKDAVVDVNFAANVLQINAGYTGTITQASGVNLTLGLYSQAGGTFTAGSGTLTTLQFFQSNGVFNGGSGNLDINGFNFQGFDLSGGTFNAPTGTMFLASAFVHESGGTFNHNGGSVVFDSGGDQGARVNGSETFNNLTLNLGNDFATFQLFAGNRLISTGTLTLTNGNFTNAAFEAQGNVSVASTFDGGGPLLITETAQSPSPRTVTVFEGARIPNTTLNAPNATMSFSGTNGTVTGGSFGLFAGTVQQGTVNFSPDSYEQTGGTYTHGSGTLTITTGIQDIVGFSQSGGTFNGGSGNIDMNAGSFVLSGGTFNAPTGTMFIGGFGFAHSVGGTFNHNGGTVALDSPNDQGLNNVQNAALTVFNNLTITTADGGFGGGGITPGSVPPRIIGTLSLIRRFISQGNTTLEAQGDVFVASTFLGGITGLSFTGTANQTYTNAGGTNLGGAWTINKPSGTVTLASDLDLSNASSLNLTDGTITTGANTVDAGNRPVVRTNGYINGNLQRRFTSPGTKVFDVGTANGYSPVGVNVTALGTNPSDLRIGAVQGVHPNVPNPNTALRRYWTLTEIGDITAVLTFNYLEIDLPPSAAESALELRRYTGSGTMFDTIPATLDTTANTSTTTSDITDFNDFTLFALAPNAAGVSVCGRVLTDQGRGISKALVSLIDREGEARYSLTNPFGYYCFSDILAGSTYIVSVSHKSWRFANPTRVVSVSDAIDGLDFTAENLTASSGVGRIEGRVLTATGAGISGVKVKLTGGSLPNPVTISTDRDGRYVFEDLQVGETYLVSAAGKHLAFSPFDQAVFLDEESRTVDFRFSDAGPRPIPGTGQQIKPQPKLK